MAIDDLINMRQAPPPRLTEDLASLEAPPLRLSILGKTRNLDRLRDSPPLEALWIGDVNERQLQDLLPRIDPLYLRFDGLRVTDLTPLTRLERLEALEVVWNTKVTDISFLTRWPHLRRHHRSC